MTQTTFEVSDEQVQAFERDGSALVRGLFDQEEIGLLQSIARADQERLANARKGSDASGRESKIWLSSEEKEDIYNAFVHCRRVADTMETLLGGAIYLYHYKMTLKEPRVGGAWEWHQDYGYWYNNDCLFPNMASCMIAVDPATKENGCLQVIPGSHKCGRIEHGKAGSQTGADEERVEKLLEHLGRTYVEMEPGDALFFHANTLHRSDANTSEHPRWILLGCFNRQDNPCREKGGHPAPRPFEKWDDETVRSIGKKQKEQMGL
jgi:ectoine hydroxylase-related dioxygenase (phytanoyl-CoA dioxygenase family)